MALLLLACVPTALAQGTYTQIDVPGAAYTYCLGINSAGDIVGNYVDSRGRFHGFLLSAGVFTTIDYNGFGTKDTYLYGINDLGQVVGATNVTGINSIYGFLYEFATQTFTQINYPGSSANFPQVINNAGVIAGDFTHHNSQYGFQLARSTYTRIVPPGGNSGSTTIRGITDSGELVGYNSTSTSYFNFSFRRGKYRRITIPNFPSAQVLGINRAGDALVGDYILDVSFNAVGFLYQNNALETLEAPGATNTYASGVNSSGKVVGWFIDENFVDHGFLWTPPADAAKR